MCLKPPRKKLEAERQSFSLFTSSKRTKRARGRGDVSLKGVGGRGDWSGADGASPLIHNAVAMTIKEKRPFAHKHVNVSAQEGKIQRQSGSGLPVKCIKSQQDSAV